MTLQLHVRLGCVVQGCRRKPEMVYEHRSPDGTVTPLDLCRPHWGALTLW